MKNILTKSSLLNQAKKTHTLEIKTDNETINIIANQSCGTFYLAKEIYTRFRSFLPTQKLIVIDLSKIENIEDSLYLTILNVSLVSKNNGIRCKIIIDQDNIGCVGYSDINDAKNKETDFCLSKIDEYRAKNCNKSKLIRQIC